MKPTKQNFVSLEATLTALSPPYPDIGIDLTPSPLKLTLRKPEPTIWYH